MLKDCGTLEHQLLLLHKVLTDGEWQELVWDLDCSKVQTQGKGAMKLTMSNIVQLLHPTCIFGMHANDSIGAVPHKSSRGSTYGVLQPQ